MIEQQILESIGSRLCAESIAADQVYREEMFSFTGDRAPTLESWHSWLVVWEAMKLWQWA